MRRLMPTILAGLLVLVIAPAAAAGPPQPVDPATLTPPVNPNFDWDCVSTGGGIICTGEQTFGAVDHSDINFGCDGNPILITFVQSETAHRFHDAAGRAIRNHVVGRFDETWRLQGSPIVLTSRGRWSETWRYPVPGDAATRTHDLHISWLISAPGLGVVAQNTGILKFAQDDSELVAVHGQHDFFDFESGLAAVCKAFGA